jgi:hypothetical protein
MGSIIMVSNQLIKTLKYTNLEIMFYGSVELLKHILLNFKRGGMDLIGSNIVYPIT